MCAGVFCRPLLWSWNGLGCGPWDVRSEIYAAVVCRTSAVRRCSLVGWFSVDQSVGRLVVGRSFEVISDIVSTCVYNVDLGEAMWCPPQALNTTPGVKTKTS